MAHEDTRDTVFAPAFRVRAGKGRTPFGFERLHSASNMLFIERAFPTALVPNRDIGVQVLGDVSDGLVSYLAGVMNGVADGGSADVDNNDGKDVSGQVAALWVLTGENATDAGIGARPRRSFDFGAGGWGAFQIAARYHALQVDDRAFALGFAAAGASRKAEGYTVGLRWYANGNLWYTLNFERTVYDRDSGGPRPAENGLAFRTQFNF